jgi:Leucine-rich repeat (LRR) protein
MGKKVTCFKCGSSNQMPEGRDSMFCAYCGSKIDLEILIKKVQKSSLQGTPKILNNQLTVNGRGLKSINEIIFWFSDSELKSITTLILSNNSIETFEGLSNFPNLTSLDLSNNQITNLDNVDFSKLSSLNFSKNKISSIENFKINRIIQKVDLSDNQIAEIPKTFLDQINSTICLWIGESKEIEDEGHLNFLFHYAAVSISFNFNNNPFKLYDWFDKIDYMSIIKNSNASQKREDDEYDENLSRINIYSTNNLSLTVIANENKRIFFDFSQLDSQVSQSNTYESTPPKNGKSELYIMLVFSLLCEIGGIAELNKGEILIGVVTILLFGVVFILSLKGIMK